MAFAAKFLRPLPRAFVFVSSSSSSSSSFFNPARFCCAKFEPSRSFPKNLGLLLSNRVSNLRLPFSRTYGISLSKSPLIGSQFSQGTILGTSVLLGSISLWPNVSLALDDIFIGDLEEDLDASDYVKSAKIFWNCVLHPDRLVSLNEWSVWLQEKWKLKTTNFSVWPKLK